MPVSERVQRLRALPTIRQQCTKVYDVVSQRKGNDAGYFELHEEKLGHVAEYCLQIIQRDFGSAYTSIPPHGRWRHFDVNGIPRISHLLQVWAGSSTSVPHAAPASCDVSLSSSPSPADDVPAIEATRRLVDLFVVSVLLDAGAGTKWRYEEAKTGIKIGRSEGLAVASIDMFRSGLFAADASGRPHLVQASGLQRMSPDALAMAMQVHPDDNPMDGLEGRAALLTRLGSVLEKDQYGYFQGPKQQQGAMPIEPKLKRPGFIIDYLANLHSTQSLPNGGKTVSLSTLWEIVIQGLADIWPASRTTLDGVALGDVWPCEALSRSMTQDNASPGSVDFEALVPFHKLSQWLVYSILEPMERILGWQFIEAQHMTGLPEYRNGGLFVDLGVLVPTPNLHKASLSQSSHGLPRLEASHAAVVEWRALTVILLDKVAELIRIKAKVGPEELKLKQVLEAATWKGGREIAKEKRSERGGGPPIEIESDGTVF